MTSSPFPDSSPLSDKNNYMSQENFDSLTPRQQEILHAIIDTTAQHGYPPTIREIGQLVGLRSTSSVSHQLKILEAKGMIVRDAGRPRAVNIYHDPPTDTIPPLSHARELPLLGNIAAGNPITAIESYDEYLTIPEELLDHGTYFLLKVQGDSMIDAAICDGDYVVIQQQSTAHNGDIVAALLDQEATIKTFHKGKDGIWLLPQNSLYPPINGNDAQILGIVTALLRKF